MRLCSVNFKGEILAGIGVDDSVVLVREINRILDIDLPERLGDLIKKERIEHLRRVTHNLILSDLPRLFPSEFSFSLPFANFGKVWQVGAAGGTNNGGVLFNHFEEILSPGASFIFSHGLKNLFAKGGVGVVIRRDCSNVEEVDVPDVVLGYTTFLKFEASSNSGSAGQDLYWGFGPWIVTHDEVDFMDFFTVTTLVHGGDGFSVKDDKFISVIRKQISALSLKTSFSPGDMVLIFGDKGSEIKSSGKVVCHVNGVGYFEAVVA